jgi:hypothetical protein
VDEVHRLDLRDLRRNGFFEGEARPIWSSSWTWGFATKPTSVVYYRRIDTEHGPEVVALVHTEGPEGGAGELIAYGVRLEWTPCHFGGLRPWWRCPLVTNGVACRRRCRILYRPYGSRYFGCRHCHRLSYRSRQTHRHWFHEGMDRARAAAVALDRARDPRCSTRRKARALLRAEKAEPAIQAMRERLGAA